MDPSFWLLVPWLVFAVGIGLKAWKVIRLLNRQVCSNVWGVERFRAGLERNWQWSQSLR
jgi:hypothetical protein